jgi:mannitol/fructose-specific phosphotransferase system IIA component (Ntr-type)
MTDALAKLLIEKGVITDAEFKEKLLQKRAVYQSILIQRSIDPGGPPDVVPA